jgi:hypothetical protein
MMAALQNSMSLLTRKGTRVNLCDRFFGFGRATICKNRSLVALVHDAALIARPRAAGFSTRPLASVHADLRSPLDMHSAKTCGQMGA